MEAGEKRIDIRLGGFACSLQGFDDPLPALTRILHELRDVQSTLPDAGRPLFDDATLSRLESEIATVAGGGVSAVPGLVLTFDAGAPDVAAPAEAAPTGVPEDAGPDPETALTGLRAAVPEDAEPDEAPGTRPASADPDAGAGVETTAADAAGTTGGNRAAGLPADTGTGAPGADEADAGSSASEALAWAPDEDQAAERAIEEPPAEDLVAGEDRSGADEDEENLFAPPSPASDEGAANLFDENGAPAPPRPEQEVDAAPAADEAAPDRAEPTADDADDANLFASEGEAGEDEATPNMFGEAVAAAEEDAPEVAAPEPAMPNAAADDRDPGGRNLFADDEDAEATAPDAHEPGGDRGADAGNLFSADGAEEAGDLADNMFDEPGPGAPGVAAAGPPTNSPFADGPDAAADTPVEAERATPGGDAEPANLFGASEEEEENAAQNLFSDEEQDGPRIAPGAFRSLARFNPLDPAPPEDEDEDEEQALPPLRSYGDISVEELARRAKAEAPADLIAAAAAWLTVIKGHGSFSKREVLDLYESLPGDRPKTAEVKVKSFGRLVRNGQVTLGDDQRFRLSEAERDRYEALLG